MQLLTQLDVSCTCGYCAARRVAIVFLYHCPGAERADNRCDDEGTCALAAVLARTHLTQLNMSGTRARRRSLALFPDQRAISSMHAHAFDLCICMNAGNHIGAEGARALAAALADHMHLTLLNIGSTYARNEKAATLA